MRVETIGSVTPDADYSRCLTITGPSGQEFTDFAAVGFTVTTKDGKSVTVKADRCGSTSGGDAQAIVSIGGEEKFRSVTPDAALKKICEEQAAADPEMMPYFFLQSEVSCERAERTHRTRATLVHIFTRMLVPCARPPPSMHSARRPGLHYAQGALHGAHRLRRRGRARRHGDDRHRGGSAQVRRVSHPAASEGALHEVIMCRKLCTQARKTHAAKAAVQRHTHSPVLARLLVD